MVESLTVKRKIPSFKEEKACTAQGYKYIAGIDEVGRGPLAGPVVAAAVILPLADDTSQITRSMGTRHRAGLGITQHSDALSIVVSEETGKVSIAREGIMTRGVRADRFKGVLRSLFTPQEESSTVRSRLKKWLGAWRRS